jgi:excisionase family DNA binding protein
MHGELESSVWGASPSGTVSRFLRHLYPKKPGRVTLGKNGISRLYLICGRAGTVNHTYKLAVDTILARSMRKHLLSTATALPAIQSRCMLRRIFRSQHGKNFMIGMLILGLVISDDSERKGFMERQQEAATPRLLLRIPEAAKALGLGRTKIYELIAAGELPVIHVGRAVRVSVTALQKWVEEQDHQQMSA